MIAVVGLLSAEDKHRQDPKLPKMSPPERIVAQHWPPYKHSGLPQGLDSTRPAFAFVNHGRWMVSCLWCSSAQHASRTDRKFFCTECSNRAVGGHWIPVIWPDNTPDIETVLGFRVDARTRNWTPGETVEGLIAENASKGAR